MAENGAIEAARWAGLDDRVGRLEVKFDHVEEAIQEQGREQKEFRSQVGDALNKLLSGQGATVSAQDEKTNARIEKETNKIQTAFARDIAELRTLSSTNATQIDNVRTAQLTSGKVNWPLIISGIGLVLGMVVAIVGAQGSYVTNSTRQETGPIKAAVEKLQLDVKDAKSKADGAVTHVEHDELRRVIDRKAEQSTVEDMRSGLNRLVSRDTTVSGQIEAASTDRNDLHSRVTKLEGDSNEGRAARMAYQQKNEADKKEIETQFKDITHVLNLERVWHGRILAILWNRKSNQDLGEFPGGQMYFPELWSSNTGGSAPAQ